LVALDLGGLAGGFEFALPLLLGRDLGLGLGRVRGLATLDFRLQSPALGGLALAGVLVGAEPGTGEVVVQILGRAGPSAVAPSKSDTTSRRSPTATTPGLHREPLAAC